MDFWLSAGEYGLYGESLHRSRKNTDRRIPFPPGGRMGLRRSDRAAIVYGNLIRKSYKKTPVILGGIEASCQEDWDIMITGRIR